MDGGMDGRGSQLVLSFLSACPVRGTPLHCTALCCAVLCYADAILVRFLVRERSSCAPRLPSTTLLTWYHHPAIARRHGQLQAPLLCWGRPPRSFRPAGLRQCRLEISCDTLLSGRLCLRWEMGGRWPWAMDDGRNQKHPVGAATSLTQGESPRARSPVPLLQSPSLAVPKPRSLGGWDATDGGRARDNDMRLQGMGVSDSFLFSSLFPFPPSIFFLPGPLPARPRPVVLRGRGLPQGRCEVPVFESLGGRGARRNQWLIPHRSGGVG